jgi:type I restriction enzyme S subunit
MVTFNLKYSEIEGLTRLDPEYYNPYYNDIVKKVRNLNSVKLSSILNIELGPAYSSKKITKKGGLPISKIGDVTNKRDFSVWDSVDLYEFGKFGSRNIKQNEILMTLTGDPPDVGKVNMPFTDYDKDDLNLAFNQRVAKLETKGINPFYLFTILSTEYFRIRFEQCAFGIRQRNVSIPDLKSAFVYLAEPIEIEKIGALTKEHFRLKTQSQSLYKQATDLLEQELGLDKIIFEKPKSYTATLSEALDFSRIDSEHYQPRYRKIREIITNYKNGYERLLTKIIAVKPSYNVTNHPSDNINYIELSNINPAMGYIDKVESINKIDAPSRAKRMVLSGDVIASSVVGSVDKAGLVSDTENEFIASNGFFQFRSSYYSSEFLLLIVKSNIVKEQFQQQSTGGILSAVPDQNLKHILIPKISFEIQNKITDLVKQSHKYIKQSQQLLADAKARVEQLIEEAANK